MLLHADDKNSLKFIIFAKIAKRWWLLIDTLTHVQLSNTHTHMFSEIYLLFSFFPPTHSLFVHLIIYTCVLFCMWEIIFEGRCDDDFREKAEEKAAMMRTRVVAAAAKSNSPSVFEASILSLSHRVMYVCEMYIL